MHDGEIPGEHPSIALWDFLSSGPQSNFIDEKIHKEIYMPGFDVLTTQLAKSGLTCPECSLLVKEAVQTPDGVRFCKSCYNEVAR